MNGIYHKLGSLKNSHYQWESRFAGHIGTYTLYYESTTDKTWVISGPSGKLILTDLEHFFEPLTELTKATLGTTTYDKLSLQCLDSKVCIRLYLRNV